MKANMPVSGKERRFDDNDNLISTTCKKGSITYVNKSFLDVSGFDREDLLKKNHNVIRHPDMPAEAFENLWQTIKNGDSWMGIVKNRCKNGDHYYVDAYVTPIMENGKVVEYQSVRTVPKKKHIERAEKLYKRIRDGKAPFKPWLQFGFVTRIMAGISMMLLSCLSLMLLVEKISYLQAGITLLVGLGFSYVIALVIAAPLVKLGAKAQSVFNNDLACMVYEGSLNEVARLNLALHAHELEVNSVVARLEDSSEQLKNIVSQTSEIASQASEGASVQQSEIEQLSTAINEMSSAVQEVARNMVEAATAAQQADEYVNAGKREVSSTISVVKEVSLEVNQAANVVRKLKSESESIGAVLDVINSVAEQTNLLALNAAIEAARAGEQGRGFAVVADEVRSLASRTQESTQEIQQMIKGIQDSTCDAVSAMENGCERVNRSVRQAEKAGVSLETIADVMGKIADMNIQVASATEEQFSVTDEINRSMVNINSVSDKSVELSTETQNTTKDLSSFASKLQSLILQFRQK